MLSYYGWIDISNSPIETDNDEMVEIQKMISSRIQMINADLYRLIELKWLNGALILSFAGQKNHKNQDFMEILDMFYWIGETARGSFGLMYVRNEDETKIANQFQVYVMKKGNVELTNDVYLSPCMPEIEDEFSDHPNLLSGKSPK